MCSISHRRACGMHPSLASVGRANPPGRAQTPADPGSNYRGWGSTLRRLSRTADGDAAALERGKEIGIAMRGMTRSATVNGSVRSFGCHRHRSCRSTTGERLRDRSRASRHRTRQACHALCQKSRFRDAGADFSSLSALFERRVVRAEFVRRDLSGYFRVNYHFARRLDGMTLLIPPVPFCFASPYRVAR
jgi:hypothetical protein